MIYRCLADCIEVSLLGLGTVKLGRREGVRYPEPFELPDEARVRRLLAVARELGINLIDTAPAYGAAEARLGRLMPGPRSSWVIVSKAGESFGAGRSVFDFSGAAIVASAERSIRTLGSEYLDVLLLHSDGNDTALLERDDTRRALEELRRRGLVRLTGISAKTAAGARLGLAALDVVMLEPALAGPFASEPEARGRVLLKKVFDSGHADRGARRAAVAAALANPAVASAVVGTIDMSHLGENAALLAECATDPTGQ